MPDPANLSMNWTDVTVSWPGGSLAIPEVVDVEVDMSGAMMPWRADARRFAELIVQEDMTRKVRIVGAALNLLIQIPRNTPCTIVGILNDLANGTGTGAVTFTAVNAVLASNPLKCRSNELGTSSASFESYSPDDSDPFSFAVAL